MTQQEIDETVREFAKEGKSIYEIDDELLQQAAPDLIVTQELCHVCAITPEEVNRAVACLPVKPRIVTLAPKVLEDVFSDMLEIGRIAGVDASSKVKQLQERVRKIAPACMLENRPAVGCVEWLDPLWRSGHWIPGMVEMAGGNEVLATIGKPSRTLPWEELLEKDPDIVILMPCGYNLEKTRTEFDRVRERYPWRQLKAFRTRNFYMVDANSYFSRSGPRLVDGLELLAEILHPEYFNNYAPLHSYSSYLE
jgi:iron complex transport system substrate-binding protein